MLETIKTKVCTKCQVEKSVELFSKDKYKKDGLAYHCKECVKAYNKSNAETIAKQKRAYRQANREKITAYHQAYKKSNRGAIAEQMKAYWQTPIGKAAHKNTKHKRRSLTRQGDVTSAQLLELQQSAKTCYWCNTSLKGKEVHIDHYIPLSKGGEHTLCNLVVSCSSCNLTKGVKDPLFFAQSIGKLF